MGTEQIKATLIDHMGSDLSTVNAARVSFGKKSDWLPESEVPTDPHTGGKIPPYKRLKESDERLVKYLAKHKHLSPFGHAFASFHVKAPIFVARQLVKQSFLRWNEVSRRYVDDEPVFYTPDVWRGRSADKKQGSEGVVRLNQWTFEIADHQYHGDLHDNGLYSAALGMYKDLLQQGVAPEQARMVLPQSTMTEWWWSGSLDAFARMCNLRLPSDTQYETRVVAEQISKVMSSLYPVSWAALMENFGE